MRARVSVRALCAVGVALMVCMSGNASADISTGSVLDISTGSVNDISTGSVLDISTGSLADISTGSVLDISTGSVNDISTGSVTARGSVAVVLIGPLDSIDADNGSFRSLGQTVMVGNSMLESLSVGDLVSVEGSIAGPGYLYADRVTISSEQYVPGATEVFVTGIPSAVDGASGRMSMGGLDIDYTPSLAVGVRGKGAIWSFKGIQPNARGLLVAGEASRF